MSQSLLVNSMKHHVHSSFVKTSLLIGFLVFMPLFTPVVTLAGSEHTLKDNPPMHINIGDETNNSFTVGFVTAQSAVAQVNVRTQGTVLTYNDKRGAGTLAKVHVISCNFQQADVNYVVVIDGVQHDNNGEPWYWSPGAPLGSPAVESVYGTVWYAEPACDQIPDEALVVSYLQDADAQGSSGLSAPSIGLSEDVGGGAYYEASLTRSEERRVGKECRSRWSPYH